jgi:hypothetical protein
MFLHECSNTGILVPVHFATLFGVDLPEFDSGVEEFGAVFVGELAEFALNVPEKGGVWGGGGREWWVVSGVCVCVCV